MQLLPVEDSLPSSMNSTITALPHLLEMVNGAEGISDIEGKATRVGASERGQRMSFNPRALTAAVTFI